MRNNRLLILISAIAALVSATLVLAVMVHYVDAVRYKALELHELDEAEVANEAQRVQDLSIAQERVTTGVPVRDLSIPEELLLLLEIDPLARVSKGGSGHADSEAKLTRWRFSDGRILVTENRSGMLHGFLDPRFDSQSTAGSPIVVTKDATWGKVWKLAQLIQTTYGAGADRLDMSESDLTLVARARGWTEWRFDYLWKYKEIKALQGFHIAVSGETGRVTRLTVEEFVPPTETEPQIDTKLAISAAESFLRNRGIEVIAASAQAELLIVPVTDFWTKKEGQFTSQIGSERKSWSITFNGGAVIVDVDAVTGEVIGGIY